jgi:hypothetical protein
MTTPSIAEPLTLPTLIERLSAVESTYLDDAIVPLKSIAMTAAGNLEIPKRGEYELTDWAKSQLSVLLGLRWDRYFKNATPLDRQDEINRRLHRANEIIKVRTAKTTGLPVVRAFVSPAYQPIPDSQAAEVLVRSMASLRTDLVVSWVQVSDRSASYVVQVGKPQGFGGIVGAVWGGVLVKNSDVGWSSFSVVAHLVRLVCTNGMRAPVGDAELVRATHRNVDLVALGTRLQDGFNLLSAGRDRDYRLIS